MAWGTVHENGCWEWLDPNPKPELEKPNSEAISYYKFSERILIKKPLDRVKFRQQTGNFTFTEIGRPFHNLYEKHLELLEYPFTFHRNLCMSGESGKLYHYILPSFFNLVINVLQRKDAEFAFVFRTYGLDATNVLKAVHAMLKGEHPCYPDIKNMNLHTSVNFQEAKIVRTDGRITLCYDGTVISDEKLIIDYLNRLPAGSFRLAFIAF